MDFDNCLFSSLSLISILSDTKPLRFKNDLFTKILPWPHLQVSGSSLPTSHSLTGGFATDVCIQLDSIVAKRTCTDFRFFLVFHAMRAAEVISGLEVETKYFTDCYGWTTDDLCLSHYTR